MRIVYQDRLPTGEEIIIRYPQEDDVNALLECINELAAEETFILIQKRQQTLEEEQEFLDSVLKKIVAKKQVFLSAWVNGKLAGSSGIELKRDAFGHEGEFGIALRETYRGKGIGKLLMKVVLEEAEKVLPDLKLVTLGVFGENTLARDIYKSFGFKEFGWLPEGVFRKGKYDDHIFMYKKIR